MLGAWIHQGRTGRYFYRYFLTRVLPFVEMSTPSQPVGQTISHYRIISKIGGGGIGVVYEGGRPEARSPRRPKVPARRTRPRCASPQPFPAGGQSCILFEPSEHLRSE